MYINIRTKSETGWFIDVFLVVFYINRGLWHRGRGFIRLWKRLQNQIIVGFRPFMGFVDSNILSPDFTFKLVVMVVLGLR